MFRIVPVVLFLVLQFMPFCSTNAQYYTDILVNREPEVSQFTTASVALFVLSPDTFMVIWKDDNLVYDLARAQCFDRNGNPLCDPFIVHGRNQVVPIGDGYIIVSEYRDADYLSQIWSYQVYKNNIPIAEPTQIQSKDDMVCRFASGGNRINLFHTNVGNIWTKWACYHFSVARQFNSDDTTFPGFDLFMAQYPDGSIMDIEFIFNQKYVYIPGSDIGWMVVKCNDQYWNRQLLLLKYDNSNLPSVRIIQDKSDWGWRTNDFMYAGMDTDSTLYVTGARSDTLEQVRIDTSGVILELTDHPFGTPDSLDRWLWFNSSHTSNLQNGRCVILLGNRDLVKKIIFQDHRIQSISEDFFSISALATRHLGSEIYQSPEGTLFISAIQDGNACLFTLDATTFTHFRTLESPRHGAHQTLTEIIPVNENEFAISFKSFDKNRAAILNTDGEIVKSQYTWPEESGMLFNDGQLLINVYESGTSSSDKINMAKYDFNNANPPVVISLLNKGENFAFGRLNKNSFYVFVQYNSYSQINVFNLNGILINSLRIDGMAIYTKYHWGKMVNGKYWMNAYRDFFLWDPETMQLESFPGLQPYTGLYPMNDSLLFKIVPDLDSPDHSAKLRLYDIHGILIKEIDSPVPVYNPFTVNIMQLDMDHNIMIDRIDYKQFEHEYRGYVFNHDLEFENTSGTCFFPEASPFVSDFNAMRMGEFLILGCTDTRDNETGKNVYTSIFNVNKLVTKTGGKMPKTIPDVFQLSAGAPNPVQSGGTIRFQLRMRQAGQVHLELYNILGQKLKSEIRQFNTGLTSFTYLPGQLAAGVYFIRVSDDHSNVVKKIAVIR